MISLLSLCSFYVAAILVGRFSRGYSRRTVLIVMLLAIAQAAIVVTAMYLMEPPSLARSVH